MDPDYTFLHHGPLEALSSFNIFHRVETSLSSPGKVRVKGHGGPR